MDPSLFYSLIFLVIALFKFLQVGQWEPVHMSACHEHLLYVSDHSLFVCFYDQG